MLELRPPEVPIDLPERKESSVKKESFIKKLFSKKEDNINLPSIDDLQLPEVAPLPEIMIAEQVAPMQMQKNEDIFMPPIAQPQVDVPALPKLEDVDWTKSDEKIESKKSKTEIDWTSTLDAKKDEPENLVLSKLLEESKKQVEELEQITKPTSPFAQVISEPKIELPVAEVPKTHIEAVNAANPKEIESIIPDIPELKKDKEFAQIEKNHQKLRKQLQDKITKPNFNATKTMFVSMLKEYDDKIEKRIIEKEIRINSEKNDVYKLHKLLKTKENEIKKLHAYLKNLDLTLKAKESKITEIIREEVAKNVNKKTASERKELKIQLNDTIRMNKLLEKKLAVIENDRKAFELKSEQLMEEERLKLTAAQQIYEDKLKQLEDEKKEFENKKLASIELLKKADEIGKEVESVQHIRNIIDSDKKKIRKDIYNDKMLRKMIDNAQKKVSLEKENLENMVFKKFIDSKLKNIKPKYVEESEDKLSYKYKDVFDNIDLAKQYLKKNKIDDAKKIYNKLKHVFETKNLPNRDRDMLFAVIKELYAEIQLTIIEYQ